MKHNLETLDVVPAFSLQIRCARDWRLGKEWAGNLHDYDLFYIWAGRGRMTLTGQSIDLFAGRGIWMRPGRRYEAEHDPAQPLGVTAVHFRLKNDRGLIPMPAFTPPMEVFDAPDPAFFESALGHVVRLLAAPKPPPSAPLILKSLLIEAAAAAEQSAGDGGLERHHREAIAGALTAIRDHPALSPAISELARRAGYSVDHFSRVFQRVTGRSPKDHIVRARMQRAVELLRGSSLTITRIAEVLGYEDIGFFSRQFKRKLGVSPARFRRGGRN